MLKLFFWLLLAANGLLFAYHQGHLENLFPSGREPARMRNQLNADKITLAGTHGPSLPKGEGGGVLHKTAAEAKSGPDNDKGIAASNAPNDAMNNTTNDAVTKTAADRAALLLAAPPALQAAEQQAVLQNGRQPANNASSAQAHSGKSSVFACTEIGNFSQAEAARFQTQLATLALANKPVRRELQETSSHMVLIPPDGDKEGAERQVAELRKLGIEDVYVIQENSPQRWGISLGIFKSEEAARTRLQLLKQKGVRNAQLVEHKISLNRLAFQWRGLDAKSRSGLAGIKANFPRQELRDCI